MLWFKNLFTSLTYSETRLSVNVSVSPKQSKVFTLNLYSAGTFELILFTKSTRSGVIYDKQFPFIHLNSSNSLGVIFTVPFFVKIGIILIYSS